MQTNIESGGRVKNKQKPGRAKPNYAPSVQQLVGSPGPTVEIAGENGKPKIWRLGFNDQNAKGALEELIRAHFIRRELPNKRALGGEDGENYWRSEVRPLLDSGYYDTFGPGWLATLKSSDGVLLFLQSLLVKFQPDITAAQTQEIFAAEPEQVMAAVEVVAPDFFAAVAVQKGYATEDAKKGGAEIAAALRETFAAHKAAAASVPTLPELVMESTAATP